MYLVNLWLRNLGIASLLLERVAAYTPIPRWGAGAAIVNDALYVHGGKTDQFNMYSYTSAPASNDVLYLPLSTPFDISLTPWQLVSSSTNSSTSQGPAVAWHTLSAFNTSGLLLFGGDPGPNSGTAVMTGSDSAALLNIFDRATPVWTSETASWANEPMRRIHHSASSTDGKLWIVGGEKDDGSNTALSDHYVFDPAGPTFTQLPSTSGPPDLFGHASIVLSDGRLLIFGGYSQSMAGLIPFSTVWVLDTTQTTLSWTSLSISSSSLPTPRRAFACVLLDGGKILIQGGADAALQNVYSDGWVLDTTQNPMVWSSVASLSQLGPRYDHFAICIDSQVIFGFGYGSSGPVSSTFQIYDSSSGSFPSSFTPSTSTPPTNTLPVPSQTHPATGTQTSPSTGTQTGNSGTSHHGSGTGAGTGTATSIGVHPTSTEGVPPSSSSSKSKSTAIAVATSFGALALVAGCVVVGIWYRNHRPYTTGGDRFHLLGGHGSEDGDGDSEHMEGVIPTAGAQREKFRSGPSAWFSTMNKESHTHPELGRALSSNGMQRRDMFADEDTREFGMFYNAGRDGSGGSSWSLKSVGAAALGGVRGILTRENSETRSLAREVSDPFSDLSIAPYGVALVRPEARRETSYASTTHSYHDPFADHPIEEVDSNSEEGEVDESTRLNQPHSSSRLSLPPISTLPPLTEVTSRSTELTGSSSSHDVRSSPFESHPSSSVTSYEYRPARSSIINSIAPPNTPIRRSDSWWTRFSKTPFLDRRSSDGGKKSPSNLFDIRDPNPAPKLLPIQEASAHSHSPDSPESQKARARQRLSEQAYSGNHRKSVSSLQTARTADSDAIERMGGMDIIQRVGTNHSHQTTPSTGRDTPDREQSWPVPRPLSVVASSGRSEGSHARMESNSTVDSPLEMTQADLGRSKSAPEGPAQPAPTHATPQRPLSGGKVLNRIQAYERRLSDVEMTSPVSPLSPDARNTKKREANPSKSRVSINYGFAPKPSLFVANPDHNGSPSSDS